MHFFDESANIKEFLQRLQTGRAEVSRAAWAARGTSGATITGGAAARFDLNLVPDLVLDLRARQLIADVLQHRSNALLSKRSHIFPQTKHVAEYPGDFVQYWDRDAFRQRLRVNTR